MDKKAVVLLYMGGPDSLEAIKPFLYNLFSDPEVVSFPKPLQKPLAWLVSTLRAPKVKKRYALIGGCSPLPAITRAQASALKKRLGSSYEVFLGMRYTKPFISEAIEGIVKAGIRDVVGLSLYPHYAGATTGTCIKEMERAIAELNAELEVSYIERWGDFPPYLDALAEKVTAAIERFPRGEDVEVIFSAHSLPESMAKRDAYEEQILATCEGVAERAKLESYRLAYQSGLRFGKWLSPSIEEVLRQLAKEGKKSVLVVPVSFVSDHIETLYEIDFQYSALARKLGIEHFRRSESLNTSPKFIEALAELVLAGG
jgi:ferrochelatase